MMKKTLAVFTTLLIVLGVSASAYAYQYGYGSAVMDLGSFNYSYTYGNTTDSGNGGVGYQPLGVYSAGLAVAYDENGYDVDAFHGAVLNDWALAYTSGSFAATGTVGPYTGSIAAAEAGDGYGEESGAAAGSFVAAYGFYAMSDVMLTIQMDYFLDGEVGGDGVGYSEAGSGAILGLYGNGAGGAIDGDWMSVDSEGGYSQYWVDDTLYASLFLNAGEYFTLFAGTAAYAYANEAAAAPVPEPATMLLLGTGLIGLAASGRKKFLKKQTSDRVGG